MKNSPEKIHIVNTLWKELKRKGVALQEVERRLGKRAGWLWDRRRYAFDIGDFWAVLGAAEIDPGEFLAKAFPLGDSVKNESDLRIVKNRMGEDT